MRRKTPEEIREWESTRLRGARWDQETNRAKVLVADPEGHGSKIYAPGVRNAVGLAAQPGAGELEK